ncbi:MAG: hypothetical protein JST52_06695 [Bacteroidetes bacterium]|nr:hypothetical protein [Bacteroidota bacterium]MBS1777111.1 hypothetical protein [Bacteroidota bacterium]
MENYNQLNEEANLKIDQTVKAELLETARWTKFIAIIGFVFLGLLILGAIFVAAGISIVSEAASLGNSYGIAIILLYLMIAVLYFFPIRYLYRFSVLINPAIIYNRQEDFNRAMSYQRRMFKFIGILCIIVIGLYALIFVTALIGIGLSK